MLGLVDSLLFDCLLGLLTCLLGFVCVYVFLKVCLGFYAFIVPVACLCSWDWLIILFWVFMYDCFDGFGC